MRVSESPPPATDGSAGDGRSRVSRSWCLAAAIVVTFEGVKLALLLGMGPAAVAMDAEEYWRLGGLIAAGDWPLEQAEIAYRTPGYPAFVGLFRATSGENAHLALLAAQHLLVLLTSLLTGWICWRITADRRAAVPGLLLSAVCLTRPWFAGSVLAETLFTFALTAHVACVVEYVKHPRLLTAALVGLTLGGAILVRPILQLWWLPLGGVVIGASWVTRRRRGRGILEVAAMLLIVFACAVPWMLRNRALFGEPFLTQFVGRNLWIVTFQPPEAAHLDFPQTPAMQDLRALAAASGEEVDLRDTWSVSQLYARTGRPDDEIDRQMTEIARAAIAEHPGQFVAAAARRAVRFWRCAVREFPFFPWPQDGPVDRQRTWGNETLAESIPDLLQRVPARSVWFNTITSALALAGAVLLTLRSRTRTVGLLLLGLLLYMNVVTATFEISNIRYRFVLEPVMIAAGVCGWAGCFRRADTAGAE